jgi:hypothetical protein
MAAAAGIRTCRGMIISYMAVVRACKVALDHVWR